MLLSDWFTIYIKHKDILERKLESIEQDGDHLKISYSDRKVTGYVLDNLTLPKIKGQTLIATLHTRENVKTLLDQWKKFSGHKDLTIVFANPKLNEKWIVRPASHSIVTNDIAQGIWAMAEHVPYFTS
ncbi:hypothetical protein GOV11_01835 [Candidatus Woesearchaeota archaeon]|nr:hypothetical protein [Candidatus Woesearchaeota archaeon]